jgi:hypothetical protein
MSKQVSFGEFCKRYNLDITLEQSKEEYKKYCGKLALINFLVSEEETKEALRKAKTVRVKL